MIIVMCGRFCRKTGTFKLFFLKITLVDRRIIENVYVKPTLGQVFL